MSKLSPIQPKLLSKINERLVMRMIQEKGPSTRAEMSRSIGITFPTVNKAVSSLLTARLLDEIEEPTTGPGRPAKRLRLATESSQVVGVTLSDRMCRITAAGLDAIVFEDGQKSFDTPATYDALLVEITKHVKQLMANGGRTTLCIGVDVPGIVDYREQRAVFSAILPIVNEKRIGRDLQDMLGVECLLIRDTHAVPSLQRLMRGQSESISNVAMLNFSAGIGLGLSIKKQFITGNNGFAGELGHVNVVPDGEICTCGKRGCLETVASERALEASVSRALDREMRLKEIIDLANSGNKVIHRELNRVCDYLAIGVSWVVNIFNPGVFFIYGRCFEEIPYLHDMLIEKVEPHVLEPTFAACRFTPATSNVLEGAIASVINHLTDTIVPDIDDYVQI